MLAILVVVTMAQASFIAYNFLIYDKQFFALIENFMDEFLRGMFE